MRRFIPLALLVIASGLGVFLYGDLNRDPAGEALSVDSDSERLHTGAPNPDDDTTSRVPTDATTSGAPATRNSPLVPRVLPPDAALEDVRDAYAHGDVLELQQSYGRIHRLGSTNAAFAKAMRRLALRESDRRVAALISQALETPWRKLTDEQRGTLSTK